MPANKTNIQLLHILTTKEIKLLQSRSLDDSFQEETFCFFSYIPKEKINQNTQFLFPQLEKTIKLPLYLEDFWQEICLYYK